MAKKTRSQLFHSAGSLKKEFGEHLSHLWELSVQQGKSLLDLFPAVTRSVTRRDTLLARENCAKAIGGDSQHTIQAIQVLEYISDIWDPKEDTLAQTIADLQILDVLPKKAKDRKSALAFMRKFFAFLEKDSLRRIRVATAGSVLCTLRVLNTSIDCRLAITNVFDWRTDSPDTYKPNIACSVPVALLSIKLSQGDPVIFQCERDELEMMVRKLQATVKELKIAEKACK